MNVIIIETARQADRTLAAVASGVVEQYGSWPRLATSDLSQIAYICSELDPAALTKLAAELRGIWSGSATVTAIIIGAPAPAAAPEPVTEPSPAQQPAGDTLLHLQERGGIGQ